MAEKSRVFIQSMTINGQDLDMDAAIKATYIEKINLDGPMLTMELRDSNTLLTDQYGLTGGSKIVCEMSDFHNEAGSSFKETFIAGPPKKEGDVITVDCFQIDCMSIKTPAIKTRYFNEKSPAFILSQLLPGLKVETDITDAGTYHLTSGMAPSRMLRAMARDYAAALFICRGKVYFKTLSSLAAQPVTYKVGTNRSRGNIDINIANMTRPDSKLLYDRTLRRQWCTIDIYGEAKKGKAQDGFPLAFISGIPMRRLDNQNTYLLPRLDMTSQGLASIVPALLLGLDIVKYEEFGEMDESIPTKLLVSSISHHQAGMSYLNRIELSEVAFE